MNVQPFISKNFDLTASEELSYLIAGYHTKSIIFPIFFEKKSSALQELIKNSTQYKMLKSWEKRYSIEDQDIAWNNFFHTNKIKESFNPLEIITPGAFLWVIEQKLNYSNRDFPSLLFFVQKNYNVVKNLIHEEIILPYLCLIKKLLIEISSDENNKKDASKAFLKINSILITLSQSISAKSKTALKIIPHLKDIIDHFPQSQDRKVYKNGVAISQEDLIAGLGLEWNKILKNHLKSLNYKSVDQDPVIKLSMISEVCQKLIETFDTVNNSRLSRQLVLKSKKFNCIEIANNKNFTTAIRDIFLSLPLTSLKEWIEDCKNENWDDFSILKTCPNHTNFLEISKIVYDNESVSNFLNHLSFYTKNNQPKSHQMQSIISDAFKCLLDIGSANVTPLNNICRIMNFFANNNYWKEEFSNPKSAPKNFDWISLQSQHSDISRTTMSKLFRSKAMENILVPLLQAPASVRGTLFAIGKMNNVELSLGDHSSLITLPLNKDPTLKWLNDIDDCHSATERYANNQWRIWKAVSENMNINAEIKNNEISSSFRQKRKI